MILNRRVIFHAITVHSMAHLRPQADNESEEKGRSDENN